MLRRRSRVPLIALLAVLALSGLGLWRRLATVAEYRNFAGDGWQYFHLAETLVRDHRYAFGPRPLPLANARLPGYPLFIAAVGFGAPRFADAEVAIRVTRAQAVLDVLTALLAFLIARELGLVAPRYLALALCVASPLLALLTAYILCETLATFLATLVLWLLLRAARERLVPRLALAGAVCGVGMLVRADLVLLAPCFLVPLSFSTESRRAKLRGALLSAALATAAFAPWPLRNLVRFRAAHTTGSEWVTKTGDPLPTGALAWLRTWVVDTQAAADVAWRMTRGNPVAAPLLPAEAFDGPAEAKRVRELLERYDREGIVTAPVDDGLREVARARRQRDPLRYWLRLPLQRVRELWWNPAPEWELPATTATLELPARRARFAPLLHRSLLLALVGLLLLLALPAAAWRRARDLADGGAPRPSSARAFATLVLVAAVARTFPLALTVPGGTERYTVELLPSVLVLAAIALAAPAELLLRRLAARPATAA